MRCIIDFETSSLKCRSPIQVGLIVINDKLEVVREFESLIKLEGYSTWDENAYAVHGIDRERLKDAPTTEQVALMLAGIFKVHESWVHSNEIIYHAQGNFDIQILNDLMIRGGLMGSGMPIKWSTYNTLKEARKHKLFDKYALSYIAAKLDYEYKAHDALSDCKATLKLIEEIRKYE